MQPELLVMGTLHDGQATARGVECAARVRARGRRGKGGVDEKVVTGGGNGPLLVETYARFLLYSLRVFRMNSLQLLPGCALE